MRAVARNVFRSAVSVVALGALVGIPASPALAAPMGFISNHDGRCLDADFSSATHDGTQVQAWQCLGGSNQLWTTYKDRTIRSSRDGRCLDEDIAGGTRNGSKVQLWACNGWDNQKWIRYADGTIRNMHDGRCLDEDIAGGTHNGSKVQVWDCNGWDNQKWHR
jgi:hypothetical protein